MKTLKAIIIFLLEAAADWIRRLHDRLGETEGQVVEMRKTQKRQFRREIEHEDRLHKINTRDLDESELSRLLSHEEPETFPGHAGENASAPGAEFRKG